MQKQRIITKETLIKRKRDLDITIEERDLIVSALNHVYDQKLQFISRNRKILSDSEIDTILKNSHAYDDLAAKIKKLK